MTKGGSSSTSRWPARAARSAAISAGQAPARRGEPWCPNRIPRITRPRYTPASRPLARFEPAYENLELGFDDMAPKTSAVSADQFRAAVIDVDLFGQLAEMAGLGAALAALDLNDSKVVGGEVRHAVSQHIRRVERLLESCRELAIFEPEGPGAELQAIAIGLGRWSAELIGAFIVAVVAPTLV